jgi:hypothetical protein
VGVNIITIRWFEDLLARGIIKPGASILDLGPQDAPGHEKPGAWYAAMGFGEYAAIDFADPRARYRADLNEPLPPEIPRGWGVIYNGGTLEHCFNIGQGFRSVHDLLAVGGIALHWMGYTGDLEHGFYNIQAGLYRDLAAANGYEVINLTVIADVDAECARLGMPLDVHWPPRSHIYTALRKTRRAEFNYPQQYCGGGQPS